MNILKFYVLIFLVITLSTISWTLCPICQLKEEDWESYKIKFNKSYASPKAEFDAKRVYAVNLQTIRRHNDRYYWNETTYSLAQNQFTDMKLEELQAKFPNAPDYIPAKYYICRCDEHNYPSDLTKKGYNLKVHNQGLMCNSGWAYSAALSAENCLKKNGIGREKSISAQRFIDCIGGQFGCVNRHQIAGIDHFSYTGQIIFDDEYPNTPLVGQGTCKQLNESNIDTTCRYIYASKISDTVSIKVLINIYGSAVGIEFREISFEFLHYSEGMFIPDPLKKIGSHFMTIVGHNKTSDGIKYWRIQNSFGEEWGERGYMRLPIGSENLGPYTFSIGGY